MSARLRAPGSGRRGCVPFANPNAAVKALLKTLPHCDIFPHVIHPLAMAFSRKNLRIQHEPSEECVHGFLLIFGSLIFDANRIESGTVT
jgi:hypothetical protein